MARQVHRRGPRRGRRPQIVLRRGRIAERHRQLPVLGLPDPDARIRRAGDQHLRHAAHGPRRRMDLRRLLHRAQGPRRRAGRPLVGRRCGRHRPHPEPGRLGAAPRPRVEEPAAQRSAAPRVRRRQIRLLHPPPGRLHRHRQRPGHRLGAGRRHRPCRDRRRDHHQPPLLPHHQGGQERRRPPSDQNPARLAPFGTRCAFVRCRAALRALPLHDRTRAPVGAAGRTGRPVHGSGGRRTHRRRVERPLLQRLDRRPRRPRLHLLCFKRHAPARGHLHRRTAGRLLPAHPRRRPHDRPQRRTTLETHLKR